jgi:acyl-CoA thioester hydrolase
LKGRVVGTPLRVRYAETDKMGVVYHSHYVVWFEVGRTEWCRAAGLPYSAMEASGLLILVTGLTCRYRKSARYDDAVTVRAMMSELGSRGCEFAYEVVNEEDEVLCDGATRHVFADVTGRPRRAPREVLDTLEAFRASGD